MGRPKKVSKFKGSKVKPNPQGKTVQYNSNPKRSVGSQIASNYHPEVRDSISQSAYSGQDADSIDQSWAEHKIATRVPSTEGIEALMQVPPGGYNTSLSKRQFKGHDPVQYLADEG